MRLNKKFYLWIPAGLIILVLVAAVSQSAVHHGKLKVHILAVPGDSQIYIDGKKSAGGFVYLPPGEHSFMASRQYFTSYKTSVKIGASQTIYLLPQPDSQQAKQYLIQNPTIQQQREEVGGQQFTNSSQNFTNSNPITTLLPYTDINGPFTINYGVGSGGIYLLISDSSPDGRAAAIRWISQQGYDPTKMDLRFSDFSNPLIGASDE